MDAELRNALWNVVTLAYWPNGDNQANYLPQDVQLYSLCRWLWDRHFKRPIDTLPTDWYGAHQIIRSYFFQCSWYEVYDFVEFIANNPNNSYSQVNTFFVKLCNDVLERELSGYRFVGGLITAVTQEEEIAEIEEAQQSTGSLKPVSGHINRAVALLADRNTPDYRNSIKESISAVEAICNLIAGSSSATLGHALGELDRQNTIAMHPALTGAFKKLYGYTSNAEGIRHALLDEPNLGFEDAKFMLVSCSSFINYLKSKAAKAGIDL
ncbi:MAG: hypothetical protein M3R38_04755 [Actinomycetota bacterium]|nr:hypothetical protein [Actinomycetota bacterium]